jgi:transcriptional regulator with XRE-family HTH domain
MVDEKRLYSALGERLKAWREGQQATRSKLTQAKLAEEVGLERTSITNIELGNQKVPLHVLYRICEVLQVSINEVLPPLSEIKAAAAEPVLEELTFAGRTEKVTPLVKQKLDMLLKNGDGHDALKN